MWFMSHAKKGKEWNTRAFREYDNPLWKATISGGNSKASLSQLVFFRSQLLHSFHWPTSLVPSLLWFLSVLTLFCLPVALLSQTVGCSSVSLPQPRRAVALQGGCQHLFGEPILPLPLGHFFVGRSFGPDLTWYWVSSLTSKGHSAHPRKRATCFN